jgi:hypothetical protein
VKQLLGHAVLKNGTLLEIIATHERVEFQKSLTLWQGLYRCSAHPKLCCSRWRSNRVWRCFPAPLLTSWPRCQQSRGAKHVECSTDNIRQLMCHNDNYFVGTLALVQTSSVCSSRTSADSNKQPSATAVRVTQTGCHVRIQISDAQMHVAGAQNENCWANATAVCSTLASSAQPQVNIPAIT